MRATEKEQAKSTALEAVRKALAHPQARVPENLRFLLHLLSHLGSLCFMSDSDGEEAAYRELFAVAVANGRESEAHSAAGGLDRIYHYSDRPELQRQVLAQYIEAARRLGWQSYDWLTCAQEKLAVLYAQAGQHAQAEELFKTALAVRVTDNCNDLSLSRTRLSYALFLMSQQRHEEAQQLVAATYEYIAQADLAPPIEVHE